jgi:hypothetical protein
VNTLYFAQSRNKSKANSFAYREVGANPTLPSQR